MKNFLALLVLCIFAGSSFAAEEAATEVPSASLSDVLAMLGEKTDGKKPAKIKVQNVKWIIVSKIKTNRIKE